MTIHNRLFKTAKCLLALLIVSLFVPATSLSADKVDDSNVLAFSNQNLRGRDKNYQPVNSWTPYFTWIGNVQDNSKLTVVNSTMGVGFLYGSGSRGSLLTAPRVSNERDAAYSFAADDTLGGFSYNRTPVYEWMYGYKFFSWLTVLFSVQSQSGINIQTAPVQAKHFTSAFATTNVWGQLDTDTVRYQFRSQLALNSLLVKVNFELPWVLVWKNWMHSVYLAFGVGPGWQSWMDNRIYATYNTSTLGVGETTFVNTPAQKYSANCVFQIDTGFRTKPACLTSNISILWGCKYNQWGQARSIAKLTQQGSYPYGLIEPIVTKLLYSFVPYLGFQWAF